MAKIYTSGGISTSRNATTCICTKYVQVVASGGSGGKSTNPKQVTNSESTNYPPDRVKNLQATIDTDENLIKIEFIATGSDLDDGKGKYDSAHWR